MPKKSDMTEGERLMALEFKMVIVWTLLTFALVTASGSAVALSRTLWNKGGDEREREITVRMLVDTVGKIADRLKALEDDRLRNSSHRRDYLVPPAPLSPTKVTP